MEDGTSAPIAWLLSKRSPTANGVRIVIRELTRMLLARDKKSEPENYLVAYRLASLVAQAVSFLPVPLWQLLQAFRSDKHMPGWHRYGYTYGALFRRWKYRSVKLLEIGIGGYRASLGGHSLLAWQAFFPFGTIIAGDIVPKQELAGRRRRIRQLDQSSAEDLAELCRQEAPFDIIIDDGSHLSAHQIFTFEHLFGALKDGGVYVVEDVQTSFWPGRVSGTDTTWDGAHISDPRFRQTCYGYFLELAKYINHTEFVDQQALDSRMLELAQSIIRIAFEHNLIIVSKEENRYPSAFVGREAVLLPSTSSPSVHGSISSLLSGKNSALLV